MKKIFYLIIIIVLNSCLSTSKISEDHYKIINIHLKELNIKQQNLDLYSRMQKALDFNIKFVLLFGVKKINQSNCSENVYNNFKLSDSTYYLNLKDTSILELQKSKLDSSYFNNFIKYEDLKLNSSVSIRNFNNIKEKYPYNYKLKNNYNKKVQELNKIRLWEIENNRKLFHVINPIFSKNNKYSFVLIHATNAKAKIYSKDKKGKWKCNCEVEFNSGFH